MGRQNSREWNKVYRLMLAEDESHKQIKSFRFSKTGLIVASITAAVVVIGAIYCIIAFTPIRATIPGYPDSHSRKDAIDNALKIDSLESMLTRWELYSENLARVISGEEILSLDSMVSEGKVNFLKSKSIEELNRQDSILRETVMNEEQFTLAERPRNLPIEGRHFFTPLVGVISNPFDRNNHPGIDISAPANSVVKATLDGTVIFSGWSEDSGYTIQVQHSGDLVSSYRHNMKLLKDVGDVVSAGTPIALVGSTGSLTSGEHLHFELWHDGKAIDPTLYISF
ncbi:MAG: M23 family metallopeptidase [Bacteroidales bacterium]|nr:M23 family metallopeptidase [Bacteroidales bacterium]